MGGSHDRRKLRRSQAPTPAAPNPVTSVSSIPAELKKDSPNFWRHVKAAVGWEGISFVTLSGFGLGFFFADRFGSARVFFWLAAASLVGRVVAYSRGNFSRHWKWSTPLTFGAIVLVLQLWIVIPWTYRTQIGHAPQKTVQIQEPQNEPPEIRAAEDRLHDDPEHLTLRDLLLTDFWPNTECHIGEVTLPLKTKPTVTLGVFFDREMASKFLAFYIPKQDFKRDLTGVIAAYLAAQYQYFLDHEPGAGLNVYHRDTGDSSMLSDAQAVFSKRIYVYHENFLSPKDVSSLTDYYKLNGGNDVIFRGSDYLVAKTQEAVIAKMKRVQATP